MAISIEHLFVHVVTPVVSPLMTYFVGFTCTQASCTEPVHLRLQPPLAFRVLAEPSDRDERGAMREPATDATEEDRTGEGRQVPVQRYVERSTGIYQPSRVWNFNVSRSYGRSLQTNGVRYK
jgi:hypothetical protein